MPEHRQSLAFQLPLYLPVLLLLSACVAGPAIETDSVYEYAAGTADIRSYRIEFADTPDFLKPMLRDEASRVLARKGLRYTEGDADAILLMTFINEPLRADSFQSGGEGSDSGMTSVVTATRFNARVNVGMTNSVTQERIWSGSLSRAHYVTEGDYMHETPAREAMRRAFSELFSAYPAAAVEYLTPP